MRSLTLRAAALKRRFLRLNSFHLFSDNWSISLSSNFGTHIQGCCGHVCFLYHLFRWSNGWLEVCIKRHYTVLFVLNGSFFIQLLKSLGHWGIFMRSILLTNISLCTQRQSFKMLFVLHRGIFKSWSIFAAKCVNHHLCALIPIWRIENLFELYKHRRALQLEKDSNEWKVLVLVE